MPGSFLNGISYLALELGRGGGGNSHILGYGMSHFLRLLFGRKINFGVYFVACNKLLGQVFSHE